MPLRKPFTATLPKGPASKMAGGSSCSGPVMEGVGSAAGAGGVVVGCCAGGVELVSCPCAPGDVTVASDCAAGTADCPAADRANKEPTRNVHRHVYTRKCGAPSDSGPNGPVKYLELAFRIRNHNQYQNIRSTSGPLFAIANMAAMLGA